MGAYINPPNDDKLGWLRENGTECTQQEAEAHEDFQDKLLVVVLDNHHFLAAGIVYDKREKTDFLREDGRRKEFFFCDVKKLLPVSNLKYYMDRQ